MSRIDFNDHYGRLHHLKNGNCRALLSTVLEMNLLSEYKKVNAIHKFVT